MNKSPNSSLVNRTIDEKYANKQRADSLKWIVVNIVLFLLFAYDLWGARGGFALRCAQACCSAVLAANIAQHTRRVLRARRAPPPPGAGGGGSALPAPAAPPDWGGPLSAARVWRAADSSPPPSPPSATRSPSPRAARLDDSDAFIADQRSLHDYLREYEERTRGEESVAALQYSSPHAPPYHVAPLAAESSPPEEGAAGARRVRVRAARWELRLRLWLRLTVLAPLAAELERAAPAPGPALLPYLAPFADRRYCARRLCELARGGCLSAYRWDGGGAAWSGAQPADAELLLHALATYLDAQLPPAPHARPFSAAHLSAAPAPPPRGPRALAIHRAAARPPHYLLVCGDDLLEVARGRSNLLHTVLLFLAAAARAEPPALQRLHLGPAGLNVLWVIGR